MRSQIFTGYQVGKATGRVWPEPSRPALVMLCDQRLIDWVRQQARPEAGRVLTAKGWRVSGDWVTVLGRGR